MAVQVKRHLISLNLFFPGFAGEWQVSGVWRATLAAGMDRYVTAQVCTWPGARIYDLVVRGG